MAALTWRSEAPHRHRLLEHLIGLVTVLLCLSLSEGVSSPLKGGVISRRVASCLNRFYLMRLLAETAALEERLRVARDVRDGVFHALTGVAFELERLLRMPKFELADAQGRLRDMQGSLADGQCALRHLISGLKRPATCAARVDVGLDARLKKLCQRLERQWGLQVARSLTGLDSLPSHLWSDVYLMAHEALINVVRHAGASTARLEVAVEDGQARIAVTDNGSGFSFKGRYDHAALAALDLGPATLKDRAAELGGVVAIDSSDTGTLLAITFPVRSLGD